jgi:hypothetical protein
MDTGDRLQRFPDLMGMFDFIVKDIRVIGTEGADTRQLRDIARRLGVRKQRDPGPVHQKRTRPLANAQPPRAANKAALAFCAERDFIMLSSTASL